MSAENLPAHDFEIYFPNVIMNNLSVARRENFLLKTKESHLNSPESLKTYNRVSKVSRFKWERRKYTHGTLYYTVESFSVWVHYYGTTMCLET